AEGSRPARERIEERGGFVGLAILCERGRLLERIRERGLVSGGNEPVPCGEELVPCEKTRQIGQHQPGDAAVFTRQSGCVPFSSAASQASPSSSPYSARPSS